MGPPRARRRRGRALPRRGARPPGAALSSLGDPDPLTDAQLEAWRTFLRAHDQLTRTLDETLRARHRMTIREFDVLVQLALADGRRMRMRDLAKAVLFSPSGLTRLCERLEAAGLVAREASESGDARGTDAVLTDEGLRRVLEARATHLRDVHERFVAPLCDDELRVLEEAMAKLT